MSHGPRAICDRCGFEFWLDQLRKEWTGLMVCGQCWDPRHPQEFVRGVRDSQGVRPNMRPETADVFVSVPDPGWYPANLTLPVVSGFLGVGETLTASTGTWSGQPTAFTFQWTNGGTNIAGETAATYETVAGDLGDTIACVVTATNDAGGSGSATATGVVIISLPANSVLPVITGTLTVGQLLSCSTGTWSGSPSYTYQWLRDGEDILGATASTYTLVSADQGHEITCEVVGTNAAGSVPAIAVATGFVGNLFLSPNDFSTASWAKTNVTIANAGTVDQAVMEVAIEDYRSVAQAITKAASAIAYRLQFDAEGVGRDWAHIGAFNASFGGEVGANFDTTNVATGDTYEYGGPTLSGTYSVSALGNGKVRCIRDFTSDTSTTLTIQFMSAETNNDILFLGDITKGVKITNALLYAL